MSTGFLTEFQLFLRFSEISFFMVQCGNIIHLNRVMIVKKPRYFLWIFAVEAVGILSGLLSREGTRLYSELVEKPALSPPAIVFPIVWTILYALMGIGAARVDTHPVGKDRSRALNEFVIQLVLNFFWSLIFFNVRAYGYALLWLVILWVFIIRMIAAFRKVDNPAGLLQIPYLLWATFAVYLNYGVWILNP